MKVKVPTMLELRAMAKAVRVEVYLISPCHGNSIGWLIVDEQEYVYRGRRGYRRARYLAGKHIEAVNRAKEAGL